MSQIDPQIWIGNAGNSQDERFQKERGITHILCCADELHYMPAFTTPSNWHHLPIVDDAADSRTEALFIEGANLLKKWVEDGHTVLVHCFAGVSRSVSLVMAYYIMFKGWSYDIAYSHCKQRRRHAHPHPDFSMILMRFTDQLPGLPPGLPPVRHQHLHLYQEPLQVPVQPAQAAAPAPSTDESNSESHTVS